MNLNTKVSYCFRIASVNRAGSSAYSPATEWITTPSLAEYTIIEYYNSRPETEEKAASQIQVRVLLCPDEILNSIEHHGVPTLATVPTTPRKA